MTGPERRGVATEQVSLTSTWFMKPGAEDELLPALQTLARVVETEEPGTLTYLVHLPSGEGSLQSLPPPNATSVTFFETYRDADAFRDHVNGPRFTRFVADYGALFVAGPGGQPYTTVDFLSPLAGFARAPEPSAPPSDHLGGTPSTANQHPSVMFEVMALHQSAVMRFYEEVFAWTFEEGSQGFQYVLFPGTAPPLMGGIGQADPDVPGLRPGCAFYLVVEALQPTIDAAVAAGGSLLMPPTQVDGYRFAMFEDPEKNPVGLVEPFTDQHSTTHPSDDTKEHP